MALIAAHISEELNAAGLMGLPFSWNPKTGAVRTDDPALTEAQRKAILAVFAAHNPLNAPPVVDAEGFFQDLQVIFTRNRLRQWVDPVMVVSWMRKSYGNLKLDLDAAKLANKVTQAEYDQIVSAARTRNLPGW